MTPVSDARGELFKGGLQIEQQQAGDDDGSCDPIMVVAYEGARQKRGHAGHLRCDAGSVGGGELVPEGEQQKAGDCEKADGE